jgi:hypothetical protein
MIPGILKNEDIKNSYSNNHSYNHIDENENDTLYQYSLRNQQNALYTSPNNQINMKYNTSPNNNINSKKQILKSDKEWINKY